MKKPKLKKYPTGGSKGFNPDTLTHYIGPGENPYNRQDLVSLGYNYETTAGGFDEYSQGTNRRFYKTVLPNTPEWNNPENPYLASSTTTPVIAKPVPKLKWPTRTDYSKGSKGPIYTNPTFAGGGMYGGPVPEKDSLYIEDKLKRDPYLSAKYKYKVVEDRKKGDILYRTMPNGKDVPVNFTNMRELDRQAYKVKMDRDLQSAGQKPIYNVFAPPTFKHGGMKLPKFYPGGEFDDTSGEYDPNRVAYENQMQTSFDKGFKSMNEPVAPAAYGQQKSGYQPNYNAMVGASSMATANFANVYQDPDATTSDKTASSRQGAAQIAGSINPIVGGIIGGVDAIAQPIKNNAEQTNSQGQLTNRNKARASAIAGSFLSPSSAITTMASGKWDLKGDKYLNEIEGNAQAQIAAEQAPILAAEEAKRNMYYTYAQGGIHNEIPYDSVDFYSLKAALSFDPMNLGKMKKHKQEYTDYLNRQYMNINYPNKSSAYIDPNLLKYNRTIGPLNKDKYAQGGIHQGMPNAEVEKQEVMRMPDGSTTQVDGPTHDNGGVPVNIPDGTQIFSDRLKDPSTKKTFAKMAEKYKIKDGDDKANHLAKSSKELVDQMKQRKLDELFQKQEELKQAKLNKYAQKLGLDTNMFKNGGTKLPKYYNAGIHMDVPEDPQIKFDNFYNSRSNMATAVDGNGQPIFFDNNQVTATDDLTRSALFNRADLPMTVGTARESFGYNTRKPTGEFDNPLPMITNQDLENRNNMELRAAQDASIPKIQDVNSISKSNTGRKMNPDWIEPATNTLMQNVGNLMYLKDQGKKYDKQEFYKYSPELYNPADALRQADIEARVNRGRLKDASGGNAGALMSNLQQSNAINTLLKSKIRNDAFNQNANTLNDAQVRNIAGKYQVDDINARNKGQALTNYYKAIQGIGMNTTAAYSDWKRGNMDKNTANMIGSMFQNYGLDINNPNDWKIFYKKASNKE